MRATSKGQVTIPKSMRDRLGIDPTTDLVAELCEDGVLIRVARDTPGRDLVAQLAAVGRVAWRGGSTDQVMRLTRGDE